jgi:hypothetical protein
LFLLAHSDVNSLSSPILCVLEKYHFL